MASLRNEENIPLALEELLNLACILPFLRAQEEVLVLLLEGGVA